MPDDERDRVEPEEPEEHEEVVDGFEADGKEGEIEGREGDGAPKGEHGKGLGQRGNGRHPVFRAAAGSGSGGTGKI